ncbi:MAG TPA: efflux RND transporter periplasmic adaptor subunit [Victivallales bacterium]|nr:efflux RND transporter periplasmic adaptor subunit [Victivallales bacterium]
MLIPNFIAFFLSFLFFITSCNKTKNNNENNTADIPVKVLNLRINKIQNLFETYGIIESLSSVQISSEQQGNIVEISAKEGECIEKGSLILKIDNSLYREEKERAEANFNLAESLFKRQKSLFEAKAISEKEYEDAFFAMKSAKAALNLATISLERCEIRSPISACIDEIYVEVGEYLTPGKKVARLEKTDIVKLVFYIPEQDISSISTGTQITYFLDSDPSKVFNAQITYIAKAADQETLTYRAEAWIENKKALLRPGMLAKVSFVRKTIENALSIPIESIIPKYGGHYVFIYENGVAKQKEVEILFLSRKEAVLSGGLKEGDKLIIDGGRFLREGDRIKIVEEF